MGQKIILAFYGICQALFSENVPVKDEDGTEDVRVQAFRNRYADPVSTALVSGLIEALTEEMRRRTSSSVEKTEENIDFFFSYLFGMLGARPTSFEEWKTLSRVANALVDGIAFRTKVLLSVEDYFSIAEKMQKGLAS